MRYQVDPDELRTLAAGLLAVRTALGRGQGQLSGPAELGELGEPGVASALTEVAANWSQARRRVLADLDQLARAAGLAASTYALVDGGPASGRAGTAMGVAP